MFVHSSIRLEEVAQRQDDLWGAAEGTRARELAQRLSGTEEVLLLWHPDSEQVELSVRELATDASFHLDVAPESALDAFYHPYAYMARRENASPVAPAVRTSLDD